MVELREITSGLLFPEGPVGLADGSVLVVEIARRRLTRVRPDGAKEIVAAPGGGPNGAATGPDGKCYVCNDGGFEFTTDQGYGLRPAREAWDYSGGRIERIVQDDHAQLGVPEHRFGRVPGGGAAAMSRSRSLGLPGETLAHHLERDLLGKTLEQVALAGVAPPRPV
jgi:SMP-30/Gluconolactonase/LRE-like region